MTSSAKIVRATLYIVRHGECTGNIAQIALEPFSDFLTDVGKTQAELLGKSLKDVPFSRAFASDYPRTFETGQIILRQSETAKEDLLKPEKRMRERDYSGVIGKTGISLVGTLTGLMRQGISYLDAEIPESETVIQFEGRLIDFVSELIQDLRKSSLDEESVLVISHALTIQRLMILLNKRSKDFGIQNWTCNLYSEKMMRNTTYHEIVLEIPRDVNLPVTGRVEYAHFREHVDGEGENGTKISREVKDKANNYAFLDDKNFTSFEDETQHYCKPV